jgi:hypothetical protein
MRYLNKFLFLFCYKGKSTECTGTAECKALNDHAALFDTICIHILRHLLLQVKKQDILESKINELEAMNEAEVEGMERMEMKIEKQELLLSDLKQQSNSLRDSISGNDRQLGGGGFRQASGSSQVPRCCCDLMCNGETVSGLYSIMGNTSVEMVYCDFSKSPQDPSK